MKSTVQNSILEDRIRKKWIFIRLKILFFAFQPYMGGRIPWKALPEGSAEGPCGRIPWKTLRNLFL